MATLRSLRTLCVLAVASSVLAMGASCMAEETREPSAEEPNKSVIICESMQGPFMDVGIGYLLPIPKHFEALSDSPMILQSFDSGNASVGDFEDRTNIVIFGEPARSIDSSRWQPMEMDRTEFSSLEFVQRSYEERNGVLIYQYGLLNSENGLFVSSSAPVDIDSLLDCLVPG